MNNAVVRSLLMTLNFIQLSITTMAIYVACIVHNTATAYVYSFVETD